MRSNSDISFSSCQWHSPALRCHFLTEASFIVLENVNRKASANYKSTGNNQTQGRGNLSDSGLLHFSLKEQQPWGVSGLGTCITKLISLALAFRRGLRNVRPNSSWRCHRITQNPCRAFAALCVLGSPHGPPCCPTSVSGWWQQRGRGGKPGGSGSRVTAPRAPTLPQRLARAGLRLTGWKRKPGISQPLCGMQIIIIIKKNTTDCFSAQQLACLGAVNLSWHRRAQGHRKM